MRLANDTTKYVQRAAITGKSNLEQLSQMYDLELKSLRQDGNKDKLNNDLLHSLPQSNVTSGTNSFKATKMKMIGLDLNNKEPGHEYKYVIQGSFSANRYKQLKTQQTSRRERQNNIMIPSQL